MRQNIHIALQHHVAKAELTREEERLLGLLRALRANATKRGGGAVPWPAAMARDRHGAGAEAGKLMLMDEPTAGMSPEETFRTGELMKSTERRAA